MIPEEQKPVGCLITAAVTVGALEFLFSFWFTYPPWLLWANIAFVVVHLIGAAVVMAKDF